MFCTNCGHELSNAPFCGNCGAPNPSASTQPQHEGEQPNAGVQQQAPQMRNPRTIPFYTTETVPGRTYSVIGLVQGSVVQAKHLGRDFLAGFKNLVGGEIKDYTAMLNEARQIAIERMQQDAARLGADAIVSMRFASAAILQGAAEMLAYGTAVCFVEENHQEEN